MFTFPLMIGDSLTFEPVFCEEEWLNINNIAGRYKRNNDLVVLVTHNNGIYMPGMDAVLTCVKIGKELRYDGKFCEWSNQEGGLIIAAMQNDRNDLNNAKVVAHEIAHKFLHKVRPPMIEQEGELKQGAHCENYINYLRCIMYPPVVWSPKYYETVAKRFCDSCTSDLVRASQAS
ncbi:MAG: hypothetical protein Q8L29_01010 [archaeon]|nr:hypothetical protein [archaeon]